MIQFGPGGNCEWFKSEGNKNSAQMPAFLNKIGLTAYEVECGRGVRMNDAVAKELRDEAEKLRKEMEERRETTMRKCCRTRTSAAPCR